jgi:hypothetical protein
MVRLQLSHVARARHAADARTALCHIIRSRIKSLLQERDQ